MNDLGARLNLKDISTQFVSVTVAMNALVESICEMANKDISEIPTSMSPLVLPNALEIPFLIVIRFDCLVAHNTLFRGNTVLTKVRLMKVYADPSRISHQHNPDHRTLHGLVRKILPRILRR